MTFGEKLQNLRKTKGLSQEQLAVQVTVSRQAVSKWELDIATPDTDNILQLSKLFGVTTDYLLDNSIALEMAAVPPPLENMESEKETDETTKKSFKKQKKSFVKISLIVFAVYITMFALANMTLPQWMPFFAMIATAISLVIITMMTRERG